MRTYRIWVEGRKMDSHGGSIEARAFGSNEEAKVDVHVGSAKDSRGFASITTRCREYGGQQLFTLWLDLHDGSGEKIVKTVIYNPKNKTMFPHEDTK